jgi:hypothetical protein
MSAQLTLLCISTRPRRLRDSPNRFRGNLAASHVLFRQNIVPAPASPSTLPRTQFHVGNNIFSLLGVGVAARRDLGALSAASGLTPRAERTNSASHRVLYAPAMDDPCVSIRVPGRCLQGRGTYLVLERDGPLLQVKLVDRVLKGHVTCLENSRPALMSPCDARDERRSYAREVPACA